MCKPPDILHQTGQSKVLHIRYFYKKAYFAQHFHTLIYIYVCRTTVQRHGSDDYDIQVSQELFTIIRPADHILPQKVIPSIEHRDKILLFVQRVVKCLFPPGKSVPEASFGFPIETVA